MNKTGPTGQAHEEIVSLDGLSRLTGMPVELIKSELFENEVVSDQIPMEQLREKMMKYLNLAMLDGSH
jgi:hypothetical protein